MVQEKWWWMSPSWRTNSPEETPRSDQFNLGYTQLQIGEGQFLLYYNKIQKKVCSSTHPSAGRQTCPDFKMERQMKVINSQLMEWTCREIYREGGGGSPIRFLEYERSLWAILRYAPFFSMWRHKTACSDFATGSLVYMLRMTPLPNSRQTENANKKWKDSV